MSAKDRAEFINALGGGGNDSGVLDQRVSQIELCLSEVLDGFEVNPNARTFTTRTYVFDDDLENNKNIVNELSVVDNHKVKYKLSETDIVDCTYYGGILTCIKDNKIVQYNVDFETGEITHKVDISPELIGTSVKLELGNREDIISRNRELLFKASVQAEGQFNIVIDYGIGVANFIPQNNSTDIAGAATIMTYNGHFKKYNILDSGEFIEDSPDIDLIELYNKIQEIN